MCPSTPSEPSASSWRSSEITSTASKSISRVTDDRLRVEAMPDGWVVAGEIDSQSAAWLLEAMSQIPAGDAVLDLSGVSFMDSSGLQAVIDATRHMRATGGELILRHPGPAVTRLIEITGLATYLRIER